jgi:hypothetical protein
MNIDTIYSRYTIVPNENNYMEDLTNSLVDLENTEVNDILENGYKYEPDIIVYAYKTIHHHWYFSVKWVDSDEITEQEAITFTQDCPYQVIDFLLFDRHSSRTEYQYSKPELMSYLIKFIPNFSNMIKKRKEETMLETNDPRGNIGSN